ncbi:MAG TPA: hypothetical protein VGL77_06880 [Armatimonadota bacterium]|jgi:hypothetical protein
MRQFLVFALLLTLCAHWGAPCRAGAPVPTATLQGRATFSDGTPAQDQQVIITIDGKQTVAQIDKDGNFSCTTPVGDATLWVLNVTKKVKLIGNQLTTINFIINPDQGIMVTVLKPDGHPIGNREDYSLTFFPIVDSELRFADGSHRSNNRYFYLPGGRIWFPADVQKATAFTVVVYSPRFFVIRKAQWPLSGDKTLYQFTLTLPPTSDITFRVLDANGHPLEGRQLTAIIVGTGELLDPSDYWGKHVENSMRIFGSEMEFPRVDRNGYLTLHGCIPLKYQLQLRADADQGKVVSFEVRADGTSTFPVNFTYQLLHQTTRTITQTLFDATGTPVAGGTQVTASYAWAGQAMFKAATANDAGRVVWTEMPPVRIITWGDNVPAGVIPVDATEITAPLPAPKPEKLQEGRRFSSEITYRLHHGDKAMTSSSFTVSSSSRDDDENTSALTTDFEGGCRSDDALSFHDSGVPFTHYMMKKGSASPPQGGMCYGYMPYLDVSPTGEIELQHIVRPTTSSLIGEIELPPVTLSPGAEVHLHFDTPDGKPVTAFSRIDLLPVQAPDWYANILNAAQTPDWLARPLQRQADGSYVAQLLCPGKYRLQLDFFCNFTEPYPPLTFDAPAGISDLTIHLPAPLVTVPANTNVYGMAKTNWAWGNTLVAHLYADQAPIFGPREALRLVMYNSDARTVNVWFEDSAGQEHRQALRGCSGFLTLNNPNLNQWSSSFSTDFANENRYTVYPPIPIDIGENWTLPYARRSVWGTWAGPHLVVAHNDPTKIFGMGEIPAKTPFDSTIDVLDYNPWASARDTTDYYIQLPPLDYAGLQGKTSRGMRLVFATPYEDFTWAMPKTEEDLHFVGELPTLAKTLTIKLPGVGIVRDMPLVTTMIANRRTLVIPPFTPGVPLSGVVLLHGKPAANFALSLSVGHGPNSDGALKVTTDAQGRFSEAHMPPGQLFVYDLNSPVAAGWVVTVPETGLTNVTLAIPEHPVRLAFPVNYGVQSRLWWIPEGGAPIYLPPPSTSSDALPPAAVGDGSTPWQQVICYGLPPGSGCLWLSDGWDGQAVSYPKVTLAAGTNILYANQQDTCPVGLAFPLAQQIGVPGAVTLTGPGTTAPIIMHFMSPAWKPIPILGQLILSITSVPVGDYQVTVQTTHGPVTGRVSVGEYGGSLQLP